MARQYRYWIAVSGGEAYQACRVLPLKETDILAPPDLRTTAASHESAAVGSGSEDGDV
ncbi:MAG: hypothetical protein U0520_00050 [Candidatus Saccharimonadales bacterium]